MQADLEEAKTQENAKLKSALQELQQQFQETKTLLIKEREAAKKAAEALLIMEREAAEKEAVQIPVIQEVPVIDHEMVNKLTAENEELKVGSHLWFFWLRFLFFIVVTSADLCSWYLFCTDAYWYSAGCHTL